MDEAALLSMRKLPCEGMKEVTTLVNTSTHKLADCTDILLGHLPLFKRANIKTLKNLAAVEAAATAKNVARAFDAVTLGMRKQAAQKGALSKDANDANGAAKEAAEICAKMKKNFMSNLKWYEPDIEARFFSVETMAPTSVRLKEESVKAAIEAIDTSSTLPY